MQMRLQRERPRAAEPSVEEMSAWTAAGLFPRGASPHPLIQFSQSQHVLATASRVYGSSRLQRWCPQSPAVGCLGNGGGRLVLLVSTEWTVQSVPLVTSATHHIHHAAAERLNRESGGGLLRLAPIEEMR